MNRKDHCASHNLCQNGATCVSKPNSNMDHPTCICRIGFTGQFCQYQHSRSLSHNSTKKVETRIEEQYVTKNRNPASKESRNRCLDDDLNPCFDKVS